jgi:hypothetical protein
MESSITIKFGSFEISCSGSEAFIEKSFPAALQNAKEVYLELGVPLGDETTNTNTPEKAPPTTNGRMPLAISTIAAKLRVDSGSSLVMAACLSLHRQGRHSCNRKEIVAEMKRATSYFKASYVNNLSASLRTLVVGGKLLEQAKDVFAIDATTAETMESQLGIS